MSDFKVGDKVRVINSYSMNHAREGIVTALGDGFSRVSFGSVDYYYSNTLLEGVVDMDISERLSEVIKENQELKQKLGEQNIKLNKIQADVRREQGVSDEEFREAFKAWETLSNLTCVNIWDGEYMLKEIFNKCSLSEFVNKYKEYKDKQDNEIKVGDVVTVKDGVSDFESLVTKVSGRVVYRLFSDGSCDGYANKEDLEKTGKHFDSIDEFMRSTDD